MGYPLKEIAEVVSGDIINFSSDEQVLNLAIDSREHLGKNTLFFAIVTEKNNGHKYIRDAYQKGVRNFVVSQEVDFAEYDRNNLIRVEDCLTALQTLAAYHRSNFSFPVIGITGSNGKTTVKEWLYQLLQGEYQIVRSPKSYNSQVGVPLSVWNMEKSDQLAIFEAGISKKGEMEKLQKIIAPTIGIITNIGDAHSENFTSKEEIATEKVKLFSSCEKIIYCRDYKAIHSVMQEFHNKELITWSTETEATLLITLIEEKESYTKIYGKIDNRTIEYTIPFIDKASIENSIACWLLLYKLNFSAEAIAKKILRLQQVAMRLELKEGVNGSTLINDSYNSDFQSLKIALQLLSHQYQHSTKTVILSDIIQTQSAKEVLYKNVSSMIKGNEINNFIGIGKDIINYSNYFPKGSKFYSNTKNFLHSFSMNDISNSAVLIKGARKFEFEKITEILQQKSHETLLEINLSAMVDNLNFFKSRLKKKTKIMAMVKAFSYGAGAHEIANVLQFHHVNYLSVAYADEGIELRKAGINTPIMVMNPETESYENMIRYNLEPEIFSFRVLEKFYQAYKENAYFIADDKQYPIHIKLDTGMHRLGFVEDELNDLMIELKKLKELQVVSIFSHLTSSEKKRHDQFTYQQITAFEKMTDFIVSKLENKPLLHILNSSGILRFPEANYDMVRLGIGLYGIATDKSFISKLRPLTVLKTTISQIKSLKKGDAIGYSREGIMKKNGRTATLPIGYADGLSRKLGNGNWSVQIQNHLFPTIGHICMDMCMVDLGDFPANEGDEVIIYGGKKSIYEFSDALEKTPYETLTGVGSRVKRIYYYE